MASYTANQLKYGTPIEALISGNTYTFTLSKPASPGTAYFTVETVADAGTYVNKPTNAAGTYGAFAGIVTEGNFANSSQYTSAVIVKNSAASYTFTPTDNVAVSSSFMKATGGMDLTIS
jgi:hypothetical protein|tara:strand:+ start:169 stop:525 length:357 start_codon:yes stop_codon:yes gene_type:complete